MSNITIKQIQEAEAFLNAHKAQILEKDFNHITCTMDEKIKSLSELGGYDTYNLIELINTEVSFRIIGRALSKYRDQLQTEKDEGYTS